MDFRIKRLAERLNSLEKRLNGFATTPQLDKSSVEDGAIDQYITIDTGLTDEDGNAILDKQLAASFGQQFDGTNTVATYTGPKPPQPSDPIVAGGAGVLSATWNGNFCDAAGNEDPMVIAPMDFSRVEVHIGTVVDFEVDVLPESTTRVASIESAGGASATIAKDAGTYYVRLVTRAASGQFSTPSNAVAVTVVSADGMSPEQIEQLNNAVDTANQAGQDASDAKATADQAATDASTAVQTAISKGQVIYQQTAPTGSRANSANLWIDTDDNIPHIYDDVSAQWIAVTDATAVQAASDAADAHQAALDAQATAVGAEEVAATANINAQSALDETAKKGAIYFGELPPKADPLGMWVDIPSEKQYGYFAFNGTNHVYDPGMTELQDDVYHELFINEILNPDIAGTGNARANWTLDTSHLVYSDDVGVWIQPTDDSSLAGVYRGIKVKGVTGLVAGTYNLLQTTVIAQGGADYTFGIHATCDYNVGQRVRLTATVNGATTTGAWTNTTIALSNPATVRLTSVPTGATVVLTVQSDTINGNYTVSLRAATFVSHKIYSVFPGCFSGGTDSQDAGQDFTYEWLGDLNNSKSRMSGKLLWVRGYWQEHRYGYTWQGGGWGAASCPNTVDFLSSPYGTANVLIVARTPADVGRQVRLVARDSQGTMTVGGPYTLTGTPQRLSWNGFPGGQVQSGTSFYVDKVLSDTGTTPAVLITNVMISSDVGATDPYFDSRYPGTSGTTKTATKGLGLGWYLTNDPKYVDPAAITTDKIADGAVTDGKVAASGISSSKIVGDNGLPGSRLVDKTVSNSKLADSAVGPGNIKPGAVTYDKLAEDAIDMARVKPNSYLTGNFYIDTGSIKGNAPLDTGILITKSYIGHNGDNVYGNRVFIKTDTKEIFTNKLTVDSTASFGGPLYMNGTEITPLSIVSRHASANFTTGTGVTIIPLDALDYNIGGVVSYSTSTGKFTVSESGIYSCIMQANTDSPSYTGYLTGHWYVNGTPGASLRVPLSGNGYASVNLAKTFKLQAGDQIWPGILLPGGGNWRGNTNGNETWAVVTFLGKAA